MKQPTVHNHVFIAPGAVVRGDVTLEENANIWYNAVIRGDTAPVIVGKNSNVQDNVVIHVDAECPTIIEENVTVGHGAILHGCKVEKEALIGMGAIVLNGAVIGAGSIVGAGALVTAGTVLPENSLAVGSPAKVIRQVSEEQRAATVANALQYVKEAQEYKALEQK